MLKGMLQLVNQRTHFAQRMFRSRCTTTQFCPTKLDSNLTKLGMHVRLCNLFPFVQQWQLLVFHCSTYRQTGMRKIPAACTEVFEKSDQNPVMNFWTTSFQIIGNFLPKMLSIYFGFIQFEWAKMCILSVTTWMKLFRTPNQFTKLPFCFQIVPFVYCLGTKRMKR